MGNKDILLNHFKQKLQEGTKLEATKIFDAVKQITGETIAREIIRILVSDFNLYITTEEIQLFNI